ncbi:MAG: glycosyltransferase [Lachnospiraceae bacterium]|nr:glycosyltransferase [Lachnospiraceae bacterium]
MGKYDYEFESIDLLPSGKLAAHIADGSTVLEFGCSTGNLARYLTEKKKCRVYAIEMDQKAFETAKQYLVDGVCGDIENDEWLDYFSGVSFDAIVFADVLEHLHNPDETLRKASILLKEDGLLLFSVPNIAHNDVIIKLLEDRFDYTETGLLDSTHIHFWGGNNLSEFLLKQGFFLVELDAQFLPTMATEQTSGNGMCNEISKNLKNFLKQHRYGEVYQFVGKANKLEYAQKVNLVFCNRISLKEKERGIFCKVYYNDGKGFNEEDCLIFYRDNDSTEIDLTAYVPKGTTEIRFDPVEGAECVLFDLSFRSGNEILDYEVCNGRKTGNSIIFLNTDPQVRVDFAGRDISSISIVARIMYLDRDTSCSVRSLLSDSDAGCQEEVKKRMQTEEKMNRLVTEQQEKERNLKVQYEEKLEAERENIRKMEDNISEMQKQAEDNMKNTIFEMQEKLHQSQLQYTKENVILEQSNSYLEKENVRLQEELFKESEKREAVQEKLHQLEMTVECENVRLKQENAGVVQENKKLSEELKKEQDKREILQEKVYQTCRQYEAKNALLEKSLEETKKTLSFAVTETEEEKRKYEVTRKSLENAEFQIETMQELLKKTKEERDCLRNTEAECQSELENVIIELAGVKNNAERMESRNQQLQLQMTTMEELHKMTQMSLESSEIQRQQLINDYRGLEGLYYSVLEERNRMLNSKSWRYTNGPRVIFSKIKKNRALSLVGKTFSALKVGGPRFAVQKIKGYFARKKQVENVTLPEGFDCSEICFETLVGELTYLSAVHSIAIYNTEKLAAYNSDFIDNNVLLVSHTLDLTGGPVAVRYFAKKLLEDGYSPVVFSPNGGELIDTLVKDGIPVVVFDQFMTSEFILKYVQLFSFAVLNTIVCAPLVSRLSGLRLPVIWWIHEAKVSYHPGQIALMPEKVGENVKIYCGGEYAKKVLLSNFPNYQADTLLYYVPDYLYEVNAGSEYSIGNTAGKIVFASIGMQEERKGQDILASAILTLSKECVERCYFLFIGKNYYEPIAAKIRYLCEKYPLNVRHIPEVNPEQLKSVYRQIDCLVCTSRDDPMPIVVTEAFLMKKLVICSENAGSAQFIQDGVNGFVYHNDDYMELVEKIQIVLDGKVNLSDIGEQARMVYMNNFGKEAFDRAIDTVIEALDTNTQSTYDVSVVIPTYNGGEQFKEMLNVLERQKNCGSVEIVVVDSGSKDGTVEACREHNVTLVEIPNEKFSHSYARNLGAESAHGKIIAFMTQDAMPSSDEWLFQMTEPIVSGEVSAVSCGEQCPEGTDLYYRIASFGHARYVGFLEKDVVGSIENCTDDDTLRRNASLNDVACIVERKVFMRFKHRFNYAEDLDLGIRLLKKGYKIKLLSGVRVVHAHNRVADYYMKRAIVENEAFFRIFPDKKAPAEDENVVVSRIVRSSCMMSEILARVDELGKKHYDTFQDFLKDSVKIFDDVMKHSDKYTSLKKNEKFQCPELEKLVDFCIQNYRIYEHPSNINPVWGVKHYLENSIVSYIDYQGIKYTKRLKNDICSCLLKQFAFAVGAEISNLGESGKLKEKVKELTKGV